MPRLEYFLVGGSCALDQLSGRISVFDILVEIRPSILPAAFPKVVSVTSFAMEPADRGVEFQFAIRTVLPSGANGPVARVNFQSIETHVNLINNWLGLPVDQPGNLQFEVALNDDVLAHHRVTVHPANPGLNEPYLIPIAGNPVEIRR